MTKKLTTLTQLKQRLDTINYEAELFRNQYEITADRIDYDDGSDKLVKAKKSLKTGYFNDNLPRNYDTTISPSEADINRFRAIILELDEKFQADKKIIEKEMVAKSQPALMFNKAMPKKQSTLFKSSTEKEKLLAAQQKNIKEILFEYRVFIDRNRDNIEDDENILTEISRLENLNELVDVNKEINKKVKSKLIQNLQNSHLRGEQQIQEEKQILQALLEGREAFNQNSNSQLEGIRTVDMSQMTDINILHSALVEQQNKLDLVLKLQQEYSINNYAWQRAQTIENDPSTINSLLNEIKTESEIKSVLSFVAKNKIYQTINKINDKCEKLNLIAVKAILNFIETAEVFSSNHPKLSKSYSALIDKLTFMRIVHEYNESKQWDSDHIDVGLVNNEEIIKAVLLFEKLNLQSYISKENISVVKDENGKAMLDESVKIINFLSEHIKDKKQIAAIFKNDKQFKLISALVYDMEKNKNITPKIIGNLIEEIAKVESKESVAIVVDRMNALTKVKSLNAPTINEKIVSHSIDLANSVLIVAKDKKESLLNTRVLTALFDDFIVENNKTSMVNKVNDSEAYTDTLSILVSDYIQQETDLLSDEYIRQLNFLPMDEMDELVQILESLNDVYKTVNDMGSSDKFKKNLSLVKSEICHVFLNKDIARDNKYSHVEEIIHKHLEPEKAKQFERLFKDALMAIAFPIGIAVGLYRQSKGQTFWHKDKDSDQRQAAKRLRSDISSDLDELDSQADTDNESLTDSEEEREVEQAVKRTKH